MKKDITTVGERTPLIKFNENDFDRLVHGFKLEEIKFPKRKEFVGWVEKLDEKTNGRYNLAKNIVDSEASQDVRTYWTNILNNNQYTNRMLPDNRIIEPILQAIIVLKREKSFLSKEEIAFIIMCSMLKIHCSVLYRRDVVSDGKSHGGFTSVCVTSAKRFGANSFSFKMIV